MTDVTPDFARMAALSRLLPPFDVTRPGRPIHIQSTKYDGSLHYAYEGRLVDQVPGLLRVVIQESTPYISYRAEGEMRARMTQLFFTDEWFNIFHNHRPIGRYGMLTYANVATPAVLDGDVIRWVDLDLDVIVSQERGLYVDDEDEFEEHRVALGYPEDVARGALRAKDHLLALAEAGGFPFDRDTHLAGDLPS